MARGLLHERVVADPRLAVEYSSVRVDLFANRKGDRRFERWRQREVGAQRRSKRLGIIQVAVDIPLELIPQLTCDNNSN
jgi:hypothetical protein